MTPDETMQADNQTVEAPPAPETSQEEQAVSPEAEQLFEASIKKILLWLTGLI